MRQVLRLAVGICGEGKKFPRCSEAKVGSSLGKEEGGCRFNPTLFLLVGLERTKVYIFYIPNALCCSFSILKMRRTAKRVRC
jgi:hypothetical protein